jgi:hypothetical protein
MTPLTWQTVNGVETAEGCVQTATAPDFPGSLNERKLMKTYNGKTVEQLVSIYNGLDEAYAAAHPAALEAVAEACCPRWISVEERLPEPLVKVLTLRISSGWTSIDFRMTEGYWQSHPRDLTHWMPLPDAPPSPPTRQRRGCEAFIRML